MTYRDLLSELQKLTEYQLDCDLTIYISDEDEYYPINDFYTSIPDNDVIDPNNPYFEI